MFEAIFQGIIEGLFEIILGGVGRAIRSLYYYITQKPRPQYTGSKSNQETEEGCADSMIGFVVIGLVVFVGILIYKFLG